MNRTLLLSLSIALLTGCVQGSVPEEPARLKPPPPANLLTKKQAKKGWKLLFDGRTTAGWRGFRSADMPAGWQAVDGALTRVAAAGDIVTVEQYGDFVLELEWMVAPRGNSGIFFRVSEDQAQVFETGPELQVLDDQGHGAELDPLTAAGSNYALHAPSKGVTRPAGEWNQVRIEVRGDHVVHWMNGEKLVDYRLWTPEWKELVAASKFGAMPGYGLNKTGHIALQDHGDGVSYRSIKIKPLH